MVQEVDEGLHVNYNSTSAILTSSGADAGKASVGKTMSEEVVLDDSQPKLFLPVDTEAHSMDNLPEVDAPPDYDQAWKAFIKMQDQHVYASKMLEVLSTADSALFLDRAIQAFLLIPIEDRKEADYQRAVVVATQRRRFSWATKVCVEVMARGIGQGCSDTLLAFFVSHGLWKNATSLWEGILKQLSASSPRRYDLSLALRSCSWTLLDDMVELPNRLLNLGDRLSRTASVFAGKEQRLRSLAEHLLYRVVNSQKILGGITGKGLLSLLDTFRELGLVTTKHYFQAFRTLGALSHTRNRSELVVMLYRNLRFQYPDQDAEKIRPWVYGTLISTCCRAGHPPSVYMFLLDEFKRMHGMPDRAAYQKVMAACASQGEVAALQKIFTMFCEDHGKPHEPAYITPLMYAYARVGDVKRTTEVFDSLKANYNIVPDTYCWNILLYAHARSQHPDETFKAFERMRQEQVRPDAYTFGTLMGVCSTSGDTQAVHQLIDQARRLGIPGTTDMVTTLIESYCLNDEVESAQHLVDSATKMRLQGSPTRMWNTLLRYHAFQRDPDAVLSTQTRMRELGVKPDDMTYAALMEALVVMGKTGDAAKILRTLHLSQSLTANQFHYSIVLNGFAREGNRDMANVIYKEMVERFPRTSVSARLSMLHLQSKRDIENSRLVSAVTGRLDRSNQFHALDYLAEVLFETTIADLATKDPQPGFQRRNPSQALHSIYVEYLVSTLDAVGQYAKAEKLLQRYESLLKASYLNQDEQSQDSIQLQTARMVGSVRRQEWAKVSCVWRDILRLAIRTGRSRSFEESGSRLNDTFTAPERAAHALRTSNIDLLNGGRAQGASEFRSMIAQELTDESHDNLLRPDLVLLEEEGLQVLPAHRFILSIPLTRYMQALDEQRRHHDIITLVEKVQGVGFRLTSKNWNTYIQLMTKSVNPKHHLHAYETFEERLLPNAPPWNLLRRGKWIDNADVVTSDGQLRSPEPVRRRTIEKIRPGLLLPTYYTVVYLATALMKMHRRVTEGDLTLELVRRRASGTIRLVQDLPYLPDRIQGLLLRGREVIGDLRKRPRRPATPDRSGLLGSKSPLDSVPLDVLEEVEKHIAPKPEDIRSSLLGLQKRANSRRVTEADVKLAEKVSGYITRSPTVLEARGQWEDGSEIVDRVRGEERIKAAEINQIKWDAQLPRNVNNPQLGEPYIAPSATDGSKHEIRPGLPAGGTLFDPYYSGIEENALHDQNVRDSALKSFKAFKAVVAPVTTVSNPVGTGKRLRKAIGGRRRFEEASRRSGSKLTLGFNKVDFVAKFRPGNTAALVRHIGQRMLKTRLSERIRVVLPRPYLSERQRQAFSNNKQVKNMRREAKARDVSIAMAARREWKKERKQRAKEKGLTVEEMETQEESSGETEVEQEATRPSDNKNELGYVQRKFR